MTSGSPRPSFDAAAWRRFFIPVLALYLVLTELTIGLRSEHFMVSAIFAGLAVYPKTAQFTRLALPYLVVGVLYDNVRLMTDLRGPIRVAELYQAELAWFGVDTPGGRQVLPLLLERYTHPVLDFFCGLAYLVYLPQTFLVGTLLFFFDRRRFSWLGWSFLLVNVLGIITWLVYPAAPPWYVQDYGLGPAVPDAAASAAGAARFDALVGLPVFEQFYARSANVFGAMPSLHCAYPAVVFLVVSRLGLRWSLPAAAFSALVSFSAVYLQHHYVWDVVAGVGYAIVASWVTGVVLEKLASKNWTTAHQDSTGAILSEGGARSSRPFG